MIADLFADTSKPYTTDPYLAEKLHDTVLSLNTAKTQFNFASEPSEIEAIIYRLKSLETEYSHILNKAKLERIYIDEVDVK